MSEDAERNEPWTIRKITTWATDDLKKRGGSSPRLDVDLLLCHVLATDRVHLLVEGEKPLSKEELTRFRALYMRRRAGEPMAYLLGTREFFGRTFRVDKRVLVPRPDTETLVEVALERMRLLDLGARVMDLCTGSGCVAISLQRERPTWRIVATDISRDALAVAEDNAIRLGATQITLLSSDLFAAIDRRWRFDLITANPPYIAEAEIPTLAVDVREFEPRIALTPGADPYAITRRIVETAPRFLDAGGALAMEIGAGQADDVIAIFERVGFTDVTTKKDLGGHRRVVSGVRAG
jgi:release factor glutamine methyltransferase